MSFKDPTDQTVRWLEILSEFNFAIEHRPGKRHQNADASSLYPCEPDEFTCYDGDTIINLPCGGCEKCQQKHEQVSAYMRESVVVPPMSSLIRGITMNCDRYAVPKKVKCFIDYFLIALLLLCGWKYPFLCTCIKNLKFVHRGLIGVRTGVIGRLRNHRRN